ncbi:MAG TPA: DUF4199 domain-containing protein [Ignavibacteriaceae bacterium]|nr:DUF4199 domain-containing protein [Ignavibacteriaceae bacterium]
MKNIKIEIKWAIFFFVMMLLWMVLEKLAGLHDANIDKHHIFTNFVAIPAIAVYVFALLDKRRNFYNGIMSYKQGFISGLIITLIVTVLSPLTQYITSTIITPDYFKNIIEYSVKENKMTRDDAESYFNLSGYIIQTIIFTPVMGIITTAIVTILTRSKK